jgi:hypothetical protein
VLYQAEPRPDWVGRPIHQNRQGFEVAFSLSLNRVA